MHSTTAIRALSLTLLGAALTSCRVEDLGSSIEDGMKDLPSYGIFFMREMNGSGITGGGDLSIQRGSPARISAYLVNVTVGARYTGHIHSGTSCTANGPVAAALPDIVGAASATPGTATRGTMTTSIDPALLGNAYYLDYHLEAAPGTQVACEAFGSPTPWPTP